MGEKEFELFCEKNGLKHPFLAKKILYGKVVSLLSNRKIALDNKISKNTVTKVMRAVAKTDESFKKKLIQELVTA